MRRIVILGATGSIGTQALEVVDGSSELEVPNPLRAADLFRTYPTGFQVFPVGHGGTTPLIMLQDLAAVGSTIRDKRVAVSLSPTWFYGISMTQLQNICAGSFSPLEVYALAFTTDFSVEMSYAP